MKNTNQLFMLPLAAALAAITLTTIASPAAHAQRTKPLSRRGAASKPNIAPGARPQPGELLQVGKMYVTGTGDNQINVRVDKIDTAPSYKFIFAGQKKVQTISDPRNFTFLIVHLTVQNLSSQPRPIFNSDGGSGNTVPYLQIGTVRQSKNQSEGQDEADYYQMDVKTYRREGDGLTLRVENPKERYNLVQPGQTVHAFIAHEALLANDPLVTQLQLNYFDSPVSDEWGTGKRIRGAAKAGLMTFDLRGSVGKAAAAAPEATTGNTGAVAWGDVETAGRRAEIGKTYRVSSGDQRLDVTVTKIETRDLEDGAGVRGDGVKVQAKVLVAFLTVHNPTKKPLLAFSMSGHEQPWLQPALWRRSINRTPALEGERADYFFTPDGKTDLTYVKDRDLSAKNPAIVQPGKTARGMIRVEYTDVATLGPLAFFRLNYSPAFNAALALTADSRRSDPVDAQAVAANLLTFPLDSLPNATPLSKQ